MTTDPNVQLGAMMRKAREAVAGTGPRFSPEAMARALRVTRDTVVRWEAGEVKPPFDRLVAYCRVLRMRGFSGRDALQIVCSGYSHEVEELNKLSQKGEASDQPISEIIEIQTIDLLEEIRLLSSDFAEGPPYFKRLFGTIEEALYEQRILMESWSTVFGLGDSVDTEDYTSRRGYEVGWCDCGDRWKLVLKEIQLRTIKESFLGYRYNEAFEIDRKPLMDTSLALMQQAATNIPALLEEVKGKLMKIPGKKTNPGQS